MKEEELTELEGALRAASPAPWRAIRLPIRARVAASVHVTAQNGTVKLVEDACNAAVCGYYADAAAIVALRNAAPRLIEERRRLLLALRVSYDEHACWAHDVAGIAYAAIGFAEAPFQGNAGVSPPPAPVSDSSADSRALLEARKLLQEVLETVHWRGDLAEKIAAFLGEQK